MKSTLSWRQRPLKALNLNRNPQGWRPCIFQHLMHFSVGDDRKGARSGYFHSKAFDYFGQAVYSDPVHSRRCSWLSEAPGEISLGSDVWWSSLLRSSTWGSPWKPIYTVLQFLVYLCTISGNPFRSVETDYHLHLIITCSIFPFNKFYPQMWCFQQNFANICFT